MRHRHRASLIGIAAAALAGGFCAAHFAAAAPAADPAALEFFESKVRPLLSQSCYECHGPDKQKAHLRLDHISFIQKGGDGGMVVAPGDIEKSRLIEAVHYTNVDMQMPPKKRLTPAQVAILETWVKSGAVWPNEAAPAVKGGPPPFDLLKRKADHWAWKPIEKRAEPAVRDAAWPVNAIDRFILAGLEEKKIRPAPQADKRALIRRLNFDLIGLPPTPAEVEAFAADTDPKATEKLVDRLLASEHFGERWGRHWLDLVRFAETRGHEFDPPIPNAWQYRDYVIRALNADVPYDRLLLEHMAGDKLDPPRLNPRDGSNESVLGTGFWLLGEEVHSPVDIRQDEADRMDNRVDTMVKAFQGLTIGCARCHDHKFDAISQKDYYALAGAAISSGYRQTPFEAMEQNRAVAAKLETLHAASSIEIAKLWGDVQRPGLSRIADYMMAAKRCGGQIQRVTEEAAASKLDAKILIAWVDALNEAQKMPDGPQNLLHAFATVAMGPGSEDPTKFAARRIAVVEAGATRAKQVDSQASAVSQIVVDYARLGPDGWFTDGVAFGLRPMRAGELTIGEGGKLRVVERGAAECDRAMGTMAPAAGTEPEFGKMAEAQLVGRMIRTPKVTLKNGKLWYLIRGTGFAYAAVDSHEVISGPLHGPLVNKLDGAGGQWRWELHDLKAYAGHRVAVEFAALPGTDFAVAEVVESEVPPTMERANKVLLTALSDPAVRDELSMAQAYQRVFTVAAHRLTDGPFILQSDERDQARLGEWLVRHPDTLSIDGENRKPLAAAVQRYTDARAELIKQLRTNSQWAPTLIDGNGVDENLLGRGQTKMAGELVPRRFLEAIAGSDQPRITQGSGRLQIAQAMLAPSDPFTARVQVNRIWHHLMGRGIVATVDNFGVLGQPPTNLPLLDWLAEHFRTDLKWSTKAMIRTIVLSRTYQMSSKPDPAAEQADPENYLLHRMPVKRLEGEAIRDAILAVSGRLDPKVLGPPVEPYLNAFMDGRGKVASGPLDGDGRRSIYARIRRNFLSPMMLAYDTPAPAACVGRRSVSNVPAQALILMNDPFVVQQASLWAKRVLAVPGQTPPQRIAAMYMTAFSRPPTADELADAAAFLDAQAQLYNIPAAARDDERLWADFAHVLFNVKEFIFVP